MDVFIPQLQKDRQFQALEMAGILYPEIPWFLFEFGRLYVGRSFKKDLLSYSRDMVEGLNNMK